MKELQVRNTQRDRRIDTRLLRKITRGLLEELLGIEEYELGIHLVTADKMAKVNEAFLQHSGPTDVITFNLNEGGPGFGGEIYVCVAVAEKQAAEFQTSWPSEVVRYVVHGILHLLGYDDLAPAQRKTMKREENRLMKRLEHQFDLSLLAR
jgi:probable rRNA maturation factor